MEKNEGFTLIEMAIVLAIVAILMSIAIPNFTTSIQDNRVVTQLNDLSTAIARARSEAVTRGIPIKISAGEDGSKTSFADGWCIHSTDQCNDSTAVVRHAPLQGVALNTKVNNAADTLSSLTFGRLGNMSEPALGPVAFLLQPTACGASQPRGRQLEISLTGRPSVTRKLQCL